MDQETFARALAASDPVAPPPPGHDPTIDRTLWDWGGARAALTVDGRLLLIADGAPRVLPVAAWLALLDLAEGG